MAGPVSCAMAFRTTCRPSGRSRRALLRRAHASSFPTCADTVRHAFSLPIRRARASRPRSLATFWRCSMRLGFPRRWSVATIGAVALAASSRRSGLNGWSHSSREIPTISSTSPGRSSRRAASGKLPCGTSIISILTEGAAASPRTGPRSPGCFGRCVVGGVGLGEGEVLNEALAVEVLGRLLPRLHEQPLVPPGGRSSFIVANAPQVIR
jgi:hypothetical protein